MKKLSLKHLLTALLLLCTTAINAYNFQVDGIYYNILSKEDKTVEVTRVNNAYLYYGSIKIPESVIYNGTTYSVASIGDKTFIDCTKLLTSVEIPSSVTNIGDSAFKGCTGLTSIEIPGSVTNIGSSAFSGCTGLTSIEIPGSVTSIGKEAFNGCEGLVSVTIPPSVKKIEIGAFARCPNITTVNISDLKAWCNIDFGIVVGERVAMDTYTGNPLYNYVSTTPNEIHGGYTHTFTAPRDLVLNGEKIVNLVIPADVDSITGHFLGCSAESLSFEKRKATTGDSCLTITRSSFAGMTNLKKVTLPDFDIRLGIATFIGCTSLEEITIACDYQWAYDTYSSEQSSYGNGIPNEIEIFQGCTHLKKLTVKEGVTNVPDMFGSQFSGTGNNREFLPIDSLIIPDLEIQSWVRPQTIDYLNEVAWYNSTLDLTTECNVLIAGEPVKAKSGELVIPEGVKKIYDGKVSGMDITKVTLPSTITHIYNGAFSNCTQLSEMNIPDNVTCIVKGAFDNTAIYNNCKENLVYIDNWLVAYKNENLGEIKIKEGTKGIAYMLFTQCTGLTGIELPASLTTIDDFAFEYCTELKNITIPSSVTYIGYNAFAGCSSLTGIEIPNSVTTIKGGAFSGCSSITRIEIPNNVTTIEDVAFSYCTSLKEITFGSNIKKIGSRAFEETAWYNNCDEMPMYLNNWLIGYKGNFEQDSLIVKEGTIGIADEAFFRKQSYISLPKSLKYIGKRAIACNDKCTFTVNATTPPTMEEYSIDYKNNHTLIVTIGSGVLNAYRQNRYWRSFGTKIASNTIGNFEYRPANDENTTIGVYKYVGNDSIVTIPAKIEFEGETLAVTKIFKEAFYKNSNITSVEIPNSITVIEGYAFDGCSNLVNTNISNNIKEIELATFRDCAKLTAISIPQSVTHIGNEAFKSCSALENVTFADGVENIGAEAFYNCSSLKGALVIPNRVTEIGENAFNGCASLTSADIPNSVTNIGSGAFYNCSSLERVTIGNGIESIGNTAFRLCSNLKTVELDCANVDTWFNSLSSIEQVVLGKNVQSIARLAFYNTKNTTLTSVTSLIPADALFAVNNLVKDYSICTLYVPTGAKETYAATSEWSNFANIVEMDLTGVEKVKGQSGESKAIYDLQGRKVDAPSNGIYIIDGKKVWIK